MTERLDRALVDRGLVRSRAQAREVIDTGRVTVAGAVVTKASLQVDDHADVQLLGTAEPWVGRAAHKLLAALEGFPEVDPVGARCLDVGASTGGFTQVLLARGAASVTALDVGHDQLAADVRADPRVEVIEGRNIREVGQGDLGPPFDLVVADLSFISLTLVLDNLAAQATDDANLVLLVKPQFEVGRERLARTGVVTSSVERTRAIRAVIARANEVGLRVRGLLPSPIEGGAGSSPGNHEYLLWVAPRTLDPESAVPLPEGIDDIDRLIAQVVASGPESTGEHRQ